MVQRWNHVRLDFKCNDNDHTDPNLVLTRSNDRRAVIPLKQVIVILLPIYFTAGFMCDFIKRHLFSLVHISEPFFSIGQDDMTIWTLELLWDNKLKQLHITYFSRSKKDKGRRQSAPVKRKHCLYLIKYSSSHLNILSSDEVVHNMMSHLSLA